MDSASVGKFNANLNRGQQISFISPSMNQNGWRECMQWLLSYEIEFKVMCN